MHEREIYHAVLGTEVELGEKKGGWPSSYPSSFISSQHQNGLNTTLVFCPLFHPVCCQMLEGGERTLKREKPDSKHNTFSDPPAASLDKIFQVRMCLVSCTKWWKGKSGRSFFLGIPRTGWACIVSCDLRLTCERVGWKQRDLPTRWL